MSNSYVPNSDSRIGDEESSAQVQPILADEADGVAYLLRRPISFLLPENPQAQEQVANLCRKQSLLLESLGQLLDAGHPPLELLIMVRDFAKRHLATATSPLPSNATRVLYLGAIAAAQLRCGKTISSLAPGELGRQFAWARQLRGVPDDLREKFQLMMTMLLSDSNGPESQAAPTSSQSLELNED